MLSPDRLLDSVVPGRECSARVDSEWTIDHAAILVDFAARQRRGEFLYPRFSDLRLFEKDFLEL